ncbi:MAG: hypothetical protein HY785_03445 [Oscillatoriophycideae cyanobacterium NC_groundwater_1537_Pr4_S-0.65um_50_18]|nr:hypothetical protein [Oscillatoriophycideae cyanobacterium NC_groundwater_1537_Pr4_S-0.65um_50_18]
MISQPAQRDPLGSPHPVPWGWVMSMLSEGRSVSTPLTRFYRSQSLLSPDGQYAAYSRIQMKLSSDSTRSRISSILFVENLKTGSLQNVAASSPFADNPFAHCPWAEEITETDQPGMIAMLIPVAWSETGDRLLAREFESFFGSDIASDFGVVWEQRSNQVHTLTPSEVSYSNAILLGWSQSYPDRVLFQAGMMGDGNWPLYAVDNAGQTLLATGDRPLTFGRMVNSIWAGPQNGTRQHLRRATR